MRGGLSFHRRGGYHPPAGLRFPFTFCHAGGVCRGFSSSSRKVFERGRGGWGCRVNSPCISLLSLQISSFFLCPCYRQREKWAAALHIFMYLQQLFDRWTALCADGRIIASLRDGSKEPAGVKVKHIAPHSTIAYLSLLVTGECSPHPPLRGPSSPPGKALEDRPTGKGLSPM